MAGEERKNKCNFFAVYPSRPSINPSINLFRTASSVSGIDRIDLCSSAASATALRTQVGAVLHYIINRPTDRESEDQRRIVGRQIEI